MRIKQIESNIDQELAQMKCTWLIWPTRDRAQSLKYDL